MATITGTNGNDSLFGSSESDRIEGLDGDDRFYGYAGNDTLVGGSGNDWLNGGSDADSMAGGDGNDDFLVSPASDTVDGGAGIDKLGFDSGSFSSGVEFDLATGVVIERLKRTSYSLVVSGIEQIEGTSSSDLIRGDAGNNELYGGKGADTLYGGAGDDLLYGDDSSGGSIAADSLDGGDGQDTLAYPYSRSQVRVQATADTSVFEIYVSGLNIKDTARSVESVQLTDGTYLLDKIASPIGVYKGTDANDWIAGSSGNDTIDGGAGFDTVDYSGSVGAVTVNLQTGLASGDGADVLLAIENVQGSPLNDKLTGDGQANSLYGNGGQDTLDGGDGNDTLDGGAGADSLLGGAGDDLLYASVDADTVHGGTGTDKLSFGFSVAGVDFDLAASKVTDRSTNNSYQLVLSGIEQFEGTPYDDVIRGDAGNNNLYGGSGSDTLYGGAGDDRLYGDTYFYNGKSSSNTLDGGDGNDTVVYPLSRSQVRVQAMAEAGAFEITIGTTTKDTVRAVESVEFSDGSFLLANIASPAGVYNGTADSETMIGSSGNDTMQGLGGYDYLDGGGGNDSLSGGDDYDTLIGGEGDDTLDGGAGVDTADYSRSAAAVSVNLQTSLASGEGADVLLSIENIQGSPLNDRLVGDSQANNLSGNGGQDTLDGGDGNDTLDGGAGADNLLGGAGDDLLYASADVDTVDGGAGTDKLRFAGFGGGVDFDLAVGKVTDRSTTASYVLLVSGIEQFEGTSSDDVIRGDAANNELYGGKGSDTLYGGAGDDLLYGDSYFYSGKSSFNSLDGGEGNDTAVYQVSRSQVHVQALPEAGVFEVTIGSTTKDTVRAVEYAKFTNGTFLLASLASPAGVYNGTADSDEMIGSSGPDTMRGLAGNDSLDGGVGNDSISGGDDSDTLMGGEGDDTLDGGAGVDTADYSRSAAAVVVNLQTGLASGQGADVLLSLENIQGSYLNDKLTGDGQANTLSGNGGQDTLDGGSGNDTLDGGAGADSVLGGAGNDLLFASRDADTLDGGAGTDKLSFAVFGSGVDFDLAAGKVTDRLSNTSYALVLSGIEQLEGTSSADVIRGDAGNNELYGGKGSDTLYGGAGDDLLYGDTYLYDSKSASSDVMSGGYGNDTLNAGAGDDRLDGGPDYDLVRFSGAKEDYSWTVLPDRSVTIRDIRPSAPDGQDMLSNIEELSFTNGSVFFPSLQGAVYHWKNHALLSNVSLQAMGPAPVDAAVQQMQVKSPSYNPGTGELSFELWANSVQPSDSFTFHVSNAQAVAAHFESALASDKWLVLSNDTESPGDVRVAAMVADGLQGVSGQIKLGKMTLTLPLNTEIRSTAVSDVFFDQAHIGGLDLDFSSQNTAPDGGFGMPVNAIGAYALEAKRSTQDSGSAITAADALAALRIAVGINPNPDPDGAAGPLKPLMLSPYQVMAADVNGNGQVTSADALAILRMAVKLNSALAPQWFFVEERRDFWDESKQVFTLNRAQAAWNTAVTTSAGAPTGNSLVGVLKGDVNGSWLPPAGSQFIDIVDPNHFVSLVQVMGVPADQWGIAGLTGQSFALT